MLLRYLPVLPPNLRPIINMANNTNISSDLNNLYKELININKKLINIKQTSLPPKLLSQEKQILQIKLNKIIDNGSNLNSANKIITPNIENNEKNI